MADSSEDIQLRELKDMVAELKNLIKTLQETVDAANERENPLHRKGIILRRNSVFYARNFLVHPAKKDLHLLRNRIFLMRQKKNSILLQQRQKKWQLPFLKKTKRRKARAADVERYKGIPVTKEYLNLEEKKCPVCGAGLVSIGEEFVRRELVFIPAQLKVVEYCSISYSCPECKRKDFPTIKKGKDGKAHMLYGMASEGPVAWVMYQKFCNSLPYYRQEKDWEQYGASITQATMANWVIRNSEAFFHPMYKYFHRKLLERGFVMADETPLQVLHEAGRRAQTKSYMWLFQSGEDDGPPIIPYKYSETRSGNTAAEFLDGFHGYLMCDGYSGYNKVPDIKRTACWAHIRRYLTDAVPQGKKLDYNQPAVQGILYIELFRLEEDIKAKHTTFDAVRTHNFAYVFKHISEKTGCSATARIE